MSNFLDHRSTVTKFTVRFMTNNIQCWFDVDLSSLTYTSKRWMWTSSPTRGNQVALAKHVPASGGRWKIACTRLSSAIEPSTSRTFHLGIPMALLTCHQQSGTGHQISGHRIRPYLASQLSLYNNQSNHRAALSLDLNSEVLRVCYNIWTKKLYLSPIHWCRIEDVQIIILKLCIVVRCSFDLWVWLPAHGHGISGHDTTTKGVQDATDSGGMQRNWAIFDLGSFSRSYTVIHIISYDAEL